MKRLVSFLFLYANAMALFAQIAAYPMGGRAWAMGNAAATLDDAWALYNNIGGLGEVENLTAFAGYDNRFGQREFQTFGAGIVAPTRFGVAGLSLSRFGDNIYSESKIGLGYARKVAQVTFGLKANYTQVSLAELGSAGKFVLEFGGQVQISKPIRFGVHIYNFTQAQFKDVYGTIYPIPTVIKAGMSYQATETLRLAIESEKDLDLPIEARFGVEYGIIKRLFLRTSVQMRGRNSDNTQTVSSHFGVGFQPKQLSFDYALGTQSNLGLTHHISMSYRFGDRKNNEEK
jgi:hypothetical protein